MVVYGKPNLILLISFCTAVYSTHFRGGVIMVKPKPGGTAREVNLMVI